MADVQNVKRETCCVIFWRSRPAFLRGWAAGTQVGYFFDFMGVMNGFLARVLL